ncbi:zinc ABC transporter substrate-binding protein [Desemzia sp. RIT804]|uniref:metal ABC transporter solute-binding protein, Zn/Mn family n=1 Tax=Desemzia sp. RIT 804 TaxID=2810209 RepID=UPI001951DAAA|nr:zinc ABC transporter substrate-binding protein [Desemzia sp. RIT 804]MBM6614971.1 zinc ABC transporter substrate-binding protein [Desemzia sp. RIT 804]
MKKKWFALILFFLTTGAALSACGQEQSGDEATENAKLSIVTTFYPMYEFTKEIAGDRADVSMMIPAGTDVHGFEPSAQNVAAINDADMFVYSSGQMETWVGSLMNTLDSEELIVVRSADNDEFIQSKTHDTEQSSTIAENDGDILEEEENVPEAIEVKGLSDHYHTGDVVQLVAQIEEYTDSGNVQWYIQSNVGKWMAVADQKTAAFEYKTTGEDFKVKAVLYDKLGKQQAQSQDIEVVIDNHEGLDPHVWLDPVLAQDQVNTIKEALIQADPEGEEYYEENAQTFNEELQKLDEEYEAAFSSAENRVFVVQHQAFGYIAQRYDLEQLAIGGLSTEVEPSPSRIAEIAELVKEYNLSVIYYQQGANSSIAQAVAQETGTEVEVLYDLEGITQEMQDEGIDYLTLMRKNLEALKLSIH